MCSLSSFAAAGSVIPSWLLLLAIAGNLMSAVLSGAPIEVYDFFVDLAACLLRV